MATYRVYWGLVRHNADFRRLYFARLISFAGDWFLLVALLGLVYEASGSALATAAVLGVQSLPAFLLAPVAGDVADRFNRKTILVVTHLVRAVLALSLLFAASVDATWFPLLIVALEGVGAAFFYPASTSALPNVVAPSDLAPANVLMGSAWGAMAAVGAALGGVFAAAVSREAAFVVDAATFLVAAVLVARISRPLQEAERAHRTSYLRSTRDALSYAFEHRPVAALLTSKAGHALITGGAIGLFAVISFELFEAGDTGTGLFFGARGLGVVIGPFLAFRLAGPSNRRIFGSIGFAMAIWGAAYLVVAVTPTLGLAALAICVGHMGGGTQWAFSTYGLQELTPDHVRGRIFAFDFGALTLSLAVSTLVVGALAETVSIRGLIAGLGVLSVAFGLSWARVTHRYWVSDHVA